MPNEKYNIYAYVNNSWVKVNEDLEGYTKTETDVLLSAKAEASGVYTKSEVDTALGTKANASTTYSKTEVDGLLDDKADSDDVYAKTETYTQTEVDNAISTAFTNAELYQIVPSLPTENIKTNKIYLVRNSKSDSGNLYDLYIRVSDAWEKIDSVEINVADFATASDMTQAQSDISDLQTNKANASDVYTKTQVYTKTEADTLLNAKAPQSTTYTKTETDGLLDDKADSDDVYTKTETYTQTEVDTAISTAVNGHNIVETVQTLPATGNARTLYLVPVASSSQEPEQSGGE